MSSPNLHFPTNGDLGTFVHLQVHTEFSLVDGIARIKPMMEAVRANGQPAIAVTEQSNLFSLVRVYTAAQAAGIKPIIGCDVWVRSCEGSDDLHRLTLLCHTTDGYRRLARLVSRSNLEGQRNGIPTVAAEWLVDTEGLIALGGGPTGAIGSALLNGRVDVAERRLAEWRERFPGRYYLDVQRIGRPQEDEYIFRVVDLCGRHDVPIVATNDVCFLEPRDFDAHEARVCIHEGRMLADPRRPRRHTEQQYLRSSREMCALFADLPEAIQNTVEIARRCTVELTLGEDILPDFPVPEGKTVDGWFIEQSKSGLEERFDELFDLPPTSETRAPYDERLEYELGVITSMGFSGYYLIVADFIEWARGNGVPVGPGRGSGAGSLAAYALRITDLDPITYELLFERFLNPERVSMPDFDIDFCMEGRDRVIDYVATRYGGDRVSQIITFGTMAARAAVRDVGRVLGHPYGFVDQLAKLIPFELGVTLDKALADEETLAERYENEEEVRSLIDLARGVEGIARNAGKHAGGVVIAPGPLTDYTPLYAEPGGSSVVTQLDKDDVASIGLVKFDFLGLRTLTILKWAMVEVNKNRSERGEPEIGLNQLPTDDEATYELIRRAETTAVFQLESRGMRELIRRLQPDCFEDIIALVALFRPGPLQSGMVDDFIERKHGRAKVSYPHPNVGAILKPTYGVILYQEQVMQIAQVLAGYSLGGADILRKAMGKKQPLEMAKQRQVFLDGSGERNVEPKTASHIFDLMEKFAGYGFNRSHSAAYALLAYQTAWLKAHHPAAFMAAVLSADMEHTDKVVVFIDECRSMKITVEKPNVNDCQYMFTAEGAVSIRYGLGAIKGIGQAAIDALVSERARGGAFLDLLDFCKRVDTKKINRRACEALIRAGALDQIGASRAALFASLPWALQAVDQEARASRAGQDDMFGGMGEDRRLDVAADVSVTGPSVQLEWTEEELLAGEKETLGLYLSGHPITRHLPELGRFVHGRLAEIRAIAGQTRVVAGLIVNMRTLNSRKGRMAVLSLDDGSARMEAVVYSDLYRRQRDVFSKDKLVVLEGEVVVDEMTALPAMTVSSAFELEGARSHFARRLSIRLDEKCARNGFVDQLAGVLEPHCRAGKIPVCIEYDGPTASVGITLGDAWRVVASEELMRRLEALAGSERVNIVY